MNPQQKGLQGAAEQYAINDTARDYYDSNRSLTEGMVKILLIAHGIRCRVQGGMTGGYETIYLIAEP